MFLESYEKTIINEYGMEYIQEHECSPYIAIAALKQYALTMYLSEPSMNPVYNQYLKLKNSSFLYNSKTDEVYKIIDCSPVSVTVKDKNNTTEIKNQQFMIDCSVCTLNEVKTRLGFIAIKKDRSTVHFIQVSDLRSKNVILWVGDFNKQKPIKHRLESKHKILNVYDFCRDYDVVVQTEFLDFVSCVQGEFYA